MQHRSMKTVRYDAGGSLRIEAVPIDAVPASLGLSAWLDTGDRHLAYRCVVTPRVRRPVVGPHRSLPLGLDPRRRQRRPPRLPLRRRRRRLGAIDANIEHPADYVDVAGPLLAQNFLVVRGDQSCPVGAGDTLAVGIVTLPHQP
jgi:hypothetical protein